MDDKTTHARLPGLSQLNAAELREQYTKELGTEVPADLTTVAMIREAITAHRTASEGQDEAPQTALDGLMEGTPSASESDASDEQDEADEQGSQEQTDLPVAFDHDIFQQTISRLNEEDFGNALSTMLGEAYERGLITNPDPTAPEPDAATTEQTGPQIAPSVAKTIAVAQEPLVAGEDELVAVKDDEERIFTKAAWKLMEADRQSWKERTNKHKDLH